MPATNLHHHKVDNSSTHTRHGHTAHLNASVVLDWNQHALEAIQPTAATPPYASRALALESIAVFDVLNAIHLARATSSTWMRPTGSPPPRRSPPPPSTS